jgi:hypothetical protein
MNTDLGKASRSSSLTLYYLSRTAAETLLTIKHTVTSVRFAMVVPPFNVFPSSDAKFRAAKDNIFLNGMLPG